MDGSGLETLSPANRDAVTAELRPGESVRWAAEPSPQMQLAGCAVWLVAIPFIGFGLFWFGASAIAMLTTRDHSLGHAAFAAFGLPFLIVGVIAFFQPWQMRAKVRRTSFALTDQRLMRIVRGNPRQVDEMPLDAIGSVSRQVLSDGSGTLTIQTFAPADAEGHRFAASYVLPGVRDVERGYRLLMAHARQ